MRMGSRCSARSASSLDTNQRGVERVFAIGSRRRAISQSDAPAQLGGEFVNGAEVAGLQFRVVIQDLLLGHAGGEPFQDVPNCDPQTANAGLAGTFTCFDRDARLHGLRISPGTN